MALITWETAHVPIHLRAIVIMKIWSSTPFFASHEHPLLSNVCPRIIFFLTKKFGHHRVFSCFETLLFTIFPPDLLLIWWPWSWWQTEVRCAACLRKIWCPNSSAARRCLRHVGRGVRRVLGAEIDILRHQSLSFPQKMWCFCVLKYEKNKDYW